jgi:hypothetical protein
MELRERNYRSRLGTRSYKARREAAEDNADQPQGDRDKFLSRNYRRPQVDVTHHIKKWAPLVIAAAIAWWAISTYVL